MIQISNKHDLVYFSKFPSTDCIDSYIGETETARRLSERVMDHAGRDKVAYRWTLFKF